jgi:RNA polymerase sigma-70 factor, ECF subfamily
MDNPLQPDYKNLTDHEIVDRCQNGDVEAFNTLIRRYEIRVLNLALRFLHDYHVAVEETQEIFLKVFRKIRDFKKRSAFGTWLYRVTVNHCLSVSSRHQRSRLGGNPTLSLDVAQEEDYPLILNDPKALRPDEAYAEADLKRKLQELIDRLPWPQRECVMLRHFEHFSYNEAAAILNVPATTVRSALHRARMNLRHWLGEEGRAHEKEKP